MDGDYDRATAKDAEGDRESAVSVAEVNDLAKFVGAVKTPKLYPKEISSHGLRGVMICLYVDLFW